MTEGRRAASPACAFVFPSPARSPVTPGPCFDTRELSRELVTRRAVAAVLRLVDPGKDASRVQEASGRFRRRNALPTDLTAAAAAQGPGRSRPAVL